MIGSTEQLSPQMILPVTTFTERRCVVAELRLVPGALTVALALRPAVHARRDRRVRWSRPRLPMFSRMPGARRMLWRKRNGPCRPIAESSDARRDAEAAVEAE